MATADRMAQSPYESYGGTMNGVYGGRDVWRGYLVGDKEEGGMCLIPLPRCHCASWSLAVALDLPPNCFLCPETFSSSCYLETKKAGDEIQLKILYLAFATNGNKCIFCAEQHSSHFK